VLLACSTVGRFDRRIFSLSASQTRTLTEAARALFDAGRAG
jgi:hypothetical protein